LVYKGQDAFLIHLLIFHCCSANIVLLGLVEQVTYNAHPLRTVL